VDDYDTPDMGLGQPAWTGEQSFWYYSLLKSRGTIKPSRAVRFTSDLTVYVEGVAKGSWGGRFWATNGRQELAYGLMQEPAFALDIAGEPLLAGWTCTQALEVEPTERGERHFVVELSHDSPRLTCRLHTLLDGTAVMTRWLELTNESVNPLPLTGVWPWTPTFIAGANYWGNANPPKVADNAFTLGYFTKPDHCWEGWFDWKPLPVGKTVIGCDRGQCYDDPFFIIRNEGTGEYAIGSLAWSANWQMELDYAQEGTHTLRCKIGPWASDALRVVAPGETITSPAVHLGLVAGDLDTAVQAMHEHIRCSVLPPRNLDRAYLVQYSLPGDQGYLSQRFGDASGYTEESVLANVDLAVSLGAELFIMDAAWWDIQGDWTASPTRFQHGLDPIIDYCHKKGLLFGLYAEIEKASPGSKIGQEHPEWIEWHAPYPVLNLANPEVAAYMEEQLASLIERYRLDLFRLDFNTPTTERYEGASFEREGHAGNNFWRYYDACYGIFERIRERFPDVILQQAACGGGRNDLGIIARFDEQYLTDGLRVPYELQNYAGQTLSLPPETLIIAHGADGGQGFGAAENLDTVLRTTFILSPPWLFAGTVGPADTPMHPERLARIRHYCDLYKSFIRPLLPTCKVFHHEPVKATGGVESSGWFVLEYASPDRKQGWATLVRIARKGDDLYFFRPRGLDPAKTYEVTFDNLGSKVKLSGLELMREGVPVRLEALASSELLLFKAK
jgi:alpha-galactosidase